ncbi:hypothetical protein B566_EDAN004775 [Ephemera danica]|nr:hypothetical protein B566_EDAN004775 [Ephemera danica]
MAAVDLIYPSSPTFTDDAAKVRVTFFQAERPLVVSSPEPDDTFVQTADLVDSTFDPAMAAAAVQGPPLQDGHPAFHRQGRLAKDCHDQMITVMRLEVIGLRSFASALSYTQCSHVSTDIKSQVGITGEKRVRALGNILPPDKQDRSPSINTDSGWDNPFRPDGDLSREADEIVELIKGGKPITPNSGTVGNSFTLPHHDEIDSSITQTEANQKSAASPLLSGPGSPIVHSPANNKKSAGANGSAAPTDSLEVQHVRVAAGDASQVEHVVIKKKQRCQCCVIQ